MASYLAISALALAFFIQGTLGSSIKCENLNKDSCAFAISATGKRCVLEQRMCRSGEEKHVCRTSGIEPTDKKLKNWIETDECIEACGLERNVFGISSDSFFESHFTTKLCSPPCYNSCPNIVDLYFNLAAGEGVYLPKLCEAQGENARRGMSERQLGTVKPAAGPITPGKFVNAPGPVSAEILIESPAPSPAF